MTAPADAAAPPPPPPAPPPLLRRTDDRVLRGVCAAVGRSTGTDPVLWRVVVAVLVLFGGTGVVLYVAGWLLIPEQGADMSIAERLLRRSAVGRGLSTAAVVALVLAAGVVVLGLRLDGNAGVVPLLAVALLAYVVLRGRTPGLRLATPVEALTEPGPVATPPPAWTAPTPSPAWAAPAWPADGWSPPAPRPRSALGLLTLSGTLLLTGVLLGLHAAGADGITLGRVLAADLVAVGLGLGVGTWWGRARWLALPALLLAAALAVTASARVPVALSLGERTWLPGTAGQPHTYRLGVGEATLDLRGLDLRGLDLRGLDLRGLDPGQVATTDLHAQLGAGHLVLQLPATLHVELTTRVAAGEVLLPGEPKVDGTQLRVLRTYGPADAPLVRLDAEIGAGQLEVRDAA